MVARAKLLSGSHRPLSHIQVHPGEAYDLTWQVSDNAQPIDWTGHRPRFRIYSQIVDRLVLVEITDPQRCAFEPDGIWRLRLTPQETKALPRGGMQFTLEHSESDSEDYQLGVIGGVSCIELRVDESHALAGGSLTT